MQPGIETYSQLDKNRFADPRIDFAFKTVFGEEENIDCLKCLLNAFLHLDGEKVIK